MTFDEQIIELQAERHCNEWWAAQRRMARGEHIYTRYCVWCNAEGKTEWKRNGVRFGEYLKRNGIELNFWQRKSIAEQYFGYRFSWNGEKWEKQK